MITIIDSKNFSRSDIKTQSPDVSKIVSNIIDSVIKQGDKAVIKYEKKFDGVELDSLLVSDSEIQRAIKSLDSKYIDMLKRAAKNIYDFHSNLFIQIKRALYSVKKLFRLKESAFTFRAVQLLIRRAS